MPPAKLSPAPVGSTSLSVGIRGQDVGLVLAEEHGAVLALLDDDELGAHRLHGTAGGDEVLGAGEQLGFAVVEHQAVELRQQLVEVGALVC